MGAILNTYFSMLLKSLGNTMLLTLLALIFALVIGLIFALMNVGKNRVFNLIGTIYVDAVRGVPLIVLAYFIYFGIPQGMKSLGFTDFRLTALQAGVAALAMNCGAYMAEIIRAGIESVDKGQMEAARSLGTSVWNKYAESCSSSGDSHDDSFHYQSVYHYIERYIHSFCDWFSGTYQYR